MNFRLSLLISQEIQTGKRECVLPEKCISLKRYQFSAKVEELKPPVFVFFGTIISRVSHEYEVLVGDPREYRIVDSRVLGAYSFIFFEGRLIQRNGFRGR